MCAKLGLYYHRLVNPLNYYYYIRYVTLHTANKAYIHTANKAYRHAGNKAYPREEVSALESETTRDLPCPGWYNFLALRHCAGLQGQLLYTPVPRVYGDVCMCGAWPT